MKRILIIEDDRAISMGLVDDFELEGFEVLTAFDGEIGYQKGKDSNVDIILLDIMLPKMSGIEVCKTLRLEKVNTPIIMLSAKSQEIDKILGLEIGADDYVIKPFSPRELQARVKALLRRSDYKEENTDSIEFENLTIDFRTHKITSYGREIELTAHEYKLLKFFIENNLVVLSRERILNGVWPEDVIVEPRVVDKHVANLRKKIEADPTNPQYIRGIRGFGYRFVMD